MKNELPKIGQVTPRRILILRATDEVRHPYETALVGLCEEIHWVDSYPELLRFSELSQTTVLVVDLDSLPFATEPPLVELRTSFPASDLIALSSNDSSQLALQCIRSGFSDFLLKPTSPEELAWSVRKCQQNHALYKKLHPRTDILRAVTQISTCTSASLVRLSTLEYLRELVSAQGAGWLSTDSTGKKLKLACSLPKTLSLQKIERKLPKNWKSERHPIVTRNSVTGMRKLLIPCHDRANGVMVLWGIADRLSSQTLANAALLVEHSELSLLNLQKLHEIRHQTFVDDLTGLYNSRYLKFALANAMLKCKSPEQSFSVLFIDVDYFKSVNDRYGHIIGSEFLVAIGKTIKNAVRNIDPVFRYGGDEFVVILQKTALDGAREIGERIRKNIERRVFLIKGQRLQTTVSIGVATFPDHATEKEGLLKLADEAMYAAKKQSRNAVHLAYGLPKEKPRRLG